MSTMTEIVFSAIVLKLKKKQETLTPKPFLPMDDPKQAAWCIF